MPYEEHTIDMLVAREIDDALVDVTVTVTGRVYSGKPGRMSGHPDTWYPPVEACAEIIIAELEDGAEIELDRDELQEAEERLLELADYSE